jgi:hypothetical protein
VTLTMRRGSTQTQRKMTSCALLKTWLRRGGWLPERKPQSGCWRRCFRSGKKGRFARILSLFATKKTSPPTSLGGQRSSDMTHSKLHEEQASTIPWTKSRCACRSISVRSGPAENGKNCQPCAARRVNMRLGHETCMNCRGATLIKKWGKSKDRNRRKRIENRRYGIEITS